MLTQAIENLLNRNLPRSPRARELTSALKGKSVRIEAQGLGWVLDCESLGSSLRLTKSGATEKSPDAEIAGSLLNLAALAGDNPEQVIQRHARRVGRRYPSDETPAEPASERRPVPEARIRGCPSTRHS